MNKTKLVAMLLTGMVALAGQINAEWTLNWRAKGKIVGNVDVGVGGGACDICPPPFAIYFPPPGANCNIPYMPWTYTIQVQTHSLTDCSEIAVFVFAIFTRPHGTNDPWTRQDTLYLAKIAPMGFCEQPPPQVGQGTWFVKNILACP